ncbi:MAG: glycosyltransferase family 1 protein [Sulfuricurvum sp.]|nr:glycosyltransferase family 1 protein [Sulfuricurvum sp.]
MKPKIIIDALALLGPLTGIGRYTYENAKELIRLDNYQIDYFYGYTSDKLITPSSAQGTKSLRSVIVKNPLVKAVIRKVMFRLSGMMASRYDLYWQPNFIPNNSIKANKIVATIHDFSWEIYPEFQPIERVKYFQKYFYSSIAQCNHIITGSDYTKREIIERVGIAPDKITVIYHGINHSVFYPRQSNDKSIQKYILAVGSIEPRKNLKNLLMAYSMLDKGFRDEYHLLLVGAAGWNNQEIVNEIKALSQWVSYSGYVSDDELATLYTNASLFIYPSVYEGFGIPPLEAMACGTPVIVSNASTLPEVCADAAYYVDPLDTQSIKEGMLTVLNNEALQKDLVTKGLARAKEFSWEKSALKHQAVFDKVLGK